MELCRRYTAFEELTTPMINEFVQKIVVHEADRSSGERVQQVDIYFSFIGKFDMSVMESEPTPEEVEAEARRLEKKRKQQEYQRSWYEKNRKKHKQEEPKTA